MLVSVEDSKCIDISHIISYYILPKCCGEKGTQRWAVVYCSTQE